MSAADGTESSHSPGDDTVTDPEFRSAQTPRSMRRQSVKGTSTKPVTKGNVIHANGAAASITAAMFQGPTNIGMAIRSGNLGALPMQTYVGSAINIAITGLILNVTMQRGAPFDSFGLLASGAAQIGFGLFFNPYPIAKSVQRSIGKQNNTTKV